MKAAVFDQRLSVPGHWLSMADLPRPCPRRGYVLVKVLSCGVCRTDLHIVEGDLPPILPRVIPGHQIIGQVVEATETNHFAEGTRVGICWIGGVDGDCWYCRHNMENLCDHPTLTGYSVNGGYAEYAVARSDFAIPLPHGFDGACVAPLLCAGTIGFRSLCVAGVKPGERVGLFGFGASASLAIQVLNSWNCETYVVTRGEAHRKAAVGLGAAWVADENATPPVELDRAITFAPSGRVVVSALSALRKGGVVAINAIHLDEMPAFDYDKLLWGERQIRSVTNVTRDDAREFIALANELDIRTPVTIFPLEEANKALEAVKHESAAGPVVIIP
jgi:alcohol dehydrogenase, propanol-preferring